MKRAEPMKERGRMISVFRTAVSTCPPARLACLSTAGRMLICAGDFVGRLEAQSLCWTGSGPVTTPCNVGIGTTGPSHALVVNATADNNEGILFTTRSG